MSDSKGNRLKCLCIIYIGIILLIFPACHSKEIIPIRTGYLTTALEKRAIKSFNQYISEKIIPGFNHSGYSPEEDLYKNAAFVDIFREDKNMQYFAATLWQVYTLIEKPEWMEYAQEYSQQLMKIYLTYNIYNDDLIQGLCVNSFRRNGDHQYREMILEIISQYVEKREEHDENKGKSDILNDICVEKLLENQILFLATRETGDPLFRYLAIQNSEKIYNNLFLNNHSNELYFGLANWEKLPGLNEMNKFYTNEFYRLAVSIYGFNMLYNETGIIKYRDLTERLAGIFMLIFEDTDKERMLANNSGTLIEERIDLISRIFISLALNDMVGLSEKVYKDTSKRIFNSVLDDLEKTDLSDNQKYNFRTFYYLFEYIIHQHLRTSLR